MWGHIAGLARVSPKITYSKAGSTTPADQALITALKTKTKTKTKITYSNARLHLTGKPGLDYLFKWLQIQSRCNCWQGWYWKPDSQTVFIYFVSNDNNTCFVNDGNILALFIGLRLCLCSLAQREIKWSSRYLLEIWESKIWLSFSFPRSPN